MCFVERTHGIVVAGNHARKGRSPSGTRANGRMFRPTEKHGGVQWCEISPPELGIRLVGGHLPAQDISSGEAGRTMDRAIPPFDNDQARTRVGWYFPDARFRCWASNARGVHVMLVPSNRQPPSRTHVNQPVGTAYMQPRTQFSPKRTSGRYGLWSQLAA
jgi:hypothetical protein